MYLFNRSISNAIFIDVFVHLSTRSCYKWPNIEKIIRPSGHTVLLIAYYSLYLCEFEEMQTHLAIQIMPQSLDLRLYCAVIDH